MSDSYTVANDIFDWLDGEYRGDASIDDLEFDSPSTIKFRIGDETFVISVNSYGEGD